MHSGIIYVLTNPSFPDYVKIGYADNLEKRLRQLNKSECLPFAFRAYCIYEVDGRLKDKDVHNLIDKLNPGLRAVETFDGKPRIREFYNISPEDAYEILYNIAAISGTTNKLRKLSPEGHEILDEKIASENNKTKNYSEKLLFENSLDSTIYLYKVLKEKILEIGQISCKPLKHYISYKILGTNKNICTVSIGKTNLHITINIKKGNLIDNKSLCKDVSTASGWKPPGDYLLEINTEDMIDYAIYLIKQAIERKKIGHETYTEEYHTLHGSELTVKLYKRLKEEILSLGDIYIEPLKQYISFKNHTSNKNIFSLEIQKKKLRITINLKKGHLLDTKCLTRDVSQIWHLAPGDYLLEMDNEDMIDYTIYLIKQAIERKKIGHETYTEEYHTLHGSELTVKLYKRLKEKILSLGDIYIEPLKQYISFKNHTSNKNIFSLEIQKKKLRITINLKKGHLLDTKCLTRDVSQIWHLAPGDYLLEMDNEDMIDYTIYLIKQAIERKKIGHETYTEEYHTLHGSKLTVRLYKLLKEEILSLGDIYIEPLKCYIAFKINSSNKNICGVEIQKEKLKVTINLKKGYLTDPECLARDISQVGHWASGDYRLEIDNENMIDYATYLIKQAVEAKK